MKNEKLIKGGKIKIEEKIELKDVEMQADPCKNSGNIPCKHDCCQDCYNGTSSWQSNKY
ncbi:hypothetical protein [Peptacetobacter sp.]|uniref:hypothetical protein n=1 Tax=Peptacetobacter sp. TaxID=2991975 RepID=UPI002628BF1C|nr:hypothetical protein [Peptacetobacter sp.]